MDVSVDISNTVLKTGRLILRAWKLSDLDDLYEYAKVKSVGEAAGWKHHESLDVSRSILDSFIYEKNVFALVFKKSGKVIGSLGLHASWANEDPDFASLKIKEIGYVLSKDYWSRGLMTEAVNAVIDHCFNTIGLDALSVGHFKENGRSRRVIEKCGFRFVKEDTFYAKQLDKTFEDKKYILIRKPGN